MSSDKFLNVKAYFMKLVPSMTEASWEICKSLISLRSVRKGELLLKEGEICNHVSFINKGLIRFYYLADGKEKSIRFLNEGNYMSDYASFLTRTPSLQYIQALEDTEVAETTFDDLQKMYRDVPEANLMGRLIAEQMFLRINAINISTSKETIEQRYLRLINEQPWLLQKVPQYMIASFLNITPEALSRVKARMNKTRKPLEMAY